MRILSSKGPRWLTVPVKVKLGQKISEVKPSCNGWQNSHIDLLRNEYKKADQATVIIPELKEELLSLPDSNLAELNIFMIKALASRLGIQTHFIHSSDLKTQGKGDDLLVNLVKSINEKATYISGEGGAKYQNPEIFFDVGLGFEYIKFEHPKYDQGGGKFEQGLSVVDCILWHGWEVTSDLISKVGTL